MPEGKHAEPQSDVEGSNTDDAPSDDCIKAQDNSIGRKKYMLYLEPQSTSGLLRGLKRSTLQRQQQLVVQSVLDAALNIPAASALPAPSDDDAAPSDDDVALSDRAQNIIRQHLGFMRGVVRHGRDRRKAGSDKVRRENALFSICEFTCSSAAVGMKLQVTAKFYTKPHQ
ncbi:uncharacterized protein LOC121906389 isoform X4 [Thunnus maccoyii]|nr:uncharacterized protein LOC121906389 isoform X4 [Thunnus maccoyii]XP_042281178.1 uncharacterized protein LOC121906389 isoform X4 [Thunnus maccoyii]